MVNKHELLCTYVSINFSRILYGYPFTSVYIECLLESCTMSIMNKCVLCATLHIELINIQNYNMNMETLC